MHKEVSYEQRVKHTKFTAKNTRLNRLRRYNRVRGHTPFPLFAGAMLQRRVKTVACVTKILLSVNNLP